MQENLRFTFHGSLLNPVGGDSFEDLGSGGTEDICGFVQQRRWNIGSYVGQKHRSGGPDDLVG
ncbi:MAG: hypothetical protein QOJ40_1080, partial [Verrucomicrobiota bacterium]